MTHCFHTYVCRIYVFAFRVCIGLRKCRISYPANTPQIRFLYIRPVFCYWLPPDPLLPRRPCQVATPSHIPGGTVDLHHQQCALPGAPAETGHRFMLAPSVFLEPQFEVAYGYAEGADFKTISATHQVTDSKLNSTDSLTGRIGMNSMVMLRTVVVRKPMTKTSLTHGLNTVSVATLM